MATRKPARIKKTSVEDTMSDILQSIQPLAEQFLLSKGKELEIQLESHRRDNEYRNAVLQHNTEYNRSYIGFIRLRFVLVFAAVSLTLLLLFGAALALIFLKERTNEGMLVISHMMALVSGLLAGIGLRSGKRQSGND